MSDAPPPDARAPEHRAPDARAPGTRPPARRPWARWALVATFWIPPACLALILHDIRQSEGWGAWAAASALKFPVFFGFGGALLGAWAIVSDLRAGRRVVWTLLLTVIAAIPALWFLARLASR